MAGNDSEQRAALNDYARKAYGSARFRILSYLGFSAVIIGLTWMSYETMGAVVVAAVIVLGLGFISYLGGAFRPIEVIVSDDLMHEGIAEMRRYDRRRRKPWSRVAGVLAFTLIFVVGYVLLSYKELQTGEETLWRIILQGLTTGIIVELVQEYFYRRNEKRLLQRLNELDGGG